MKTLSLLSLVGLAATWSVGALAGTIQFGEPVVRGNGCSATSTGVALSPDSSLVSILFDQMSAESGPALGRSFERRNCQISLPVFLPAQKSLAVVEADLRGFINLPGRARADVLTTYSVRSPQTNTPGVRLEQRFVGPRTEDFLLNQRSQSLTAGCGGRVDLQMNINLTSVADAIHPESAIVSLDSADLSGSVKSALRYKVRLVDCNSRHVGPPTLPPRHGDGRVPVRPR